VGRGKGGDGRRKRRERGKEEIPKFGTACASSNTLTISNKLLSLKLKSTLKFPGTTSPQLPLSAVLL
jgi:hypothetical protein